MAAHADSDEGMSLKGKTIGISAVGTDHNWDLKAYQGQIDELKRLGAKSLLWTPAATTRPRSVSSRR